MRSTSSRPNPEESPLWAGDGVVTPHAAAAIENTYRRVAAIVEEDVRRYDDGEAFANRVV